MADEPQPDPQSENTRLLAELNAARARADDAERRANAYEAQVTDGSRRLASAQVNQLTLQEQQAQTNLESIEAEIKGLKQHHVALMAEGKFDEAADTAEKVADAAARRREYHNAKTYYGNQRTQAAAVPSDPVERWLADRQGQYSEDEQRWIKQHRRYALDADFQQRVIKAHGEAIEQLSLPRGSPEYFAHLERRGYLRPDPNPAPQPQAQAHQAEQAGGEAETAEAGDVEGEIQVPEQQVEEPQPRAAGAGSLRAAIAASPSRRSPTAPSGRRIVATLTQDEQDTAMALAGSLAPPEVQQAGGPAILAWYSDLKNSPTAQRIAANWAKG